MQYLFIIREFFCRYTYIYINDRILFFLLITLFMDVVLEKRSQREMNKIVAHKAINNIVRDTF